MEAAEIERRQQKAWGMHDLGYNCAQCVGLATCDLVGLEEDHAFRLLEGFGGGMGNFTQTCGAISGGIMVVSYANSRGMELHNSKPQTYALSALLTTRFLEQFPSTLCGEIRPTDPDIIKPTCNGYIGAMVKLTCELLDEEGLIK